MMSHETQTEISIRPVRHGDEPLVQEIIDGMSPESRYFRFLQAMPKLSDGMRRTLANVDGVRHKAWAAYMGDRPVGIVRLVVDQHGDYELSVAVVDAVHRRGIGRKLVTTALEGAARDGVESVTLMVHPENGASISMFRRLGASFRFEFGLLVGTLPAHVTAEAAA
jgi:acetyltransferase